MLTFFISLHQRVGKIEHMQLYTIGVNHTTAPIAIRENVAFNDANLRHALSDLTAKNVAEAAILSTCNRTEIYVQSATPEPIINWLAQYHRLDISIFSLTPIHCATKMQLNTPFAWPAV